MRRASSGIPEQRLSLFFSLSYLCARRVSAVNVLPQVFFSARLPLGSLRRLGMSFGDRFFFCSYQKSRFTSDFEHPLCVEISVELDQLRHQTRPTCLMWCPEAGPVVTMEILIKENVVAPVRV